MDKYSFKDDSHDDSNDSQVIESSNLDRMRLRAIGRFISDSWKSAGEREEEQRNREKAGYSNLANRDEDQHKKPIKLSERLQGASKRFEKDKNEYFYYLRQLSIDSNHSIGGILETNKSDPLTIFTKRGGNNTLVKEDSAVIQIEAYGELQYTLFKHKIKGRKCYKLMPFVHESIEYAYTPFLHPNHEFYYPRPLTNVMEARIQRWQQEYDDMPIAEIKKSALRNFKNLTYFELFQVINPECCKQSESFYPSDFQEISAFIRSNFELINQQGLHTGSTEDRAAKVIKSKNRTLVCEQKIVVRSNENFYFGSAKEYNEYIDYRMIEFKNEKIFSKDFEARTNISKIISTSKIYLIQLVGEVQKLKELAIVARSDSNLDSLRLVDGLLARKADQYVRVLIDFSTSDVLLAYHLEDVPQKLLEFITKSIKFGQSLENVSDQVLQDYPYLRVLYELPTSVYGFLSIDLRQYLYDMMVELLQFREKIRETQRYEHFKKKVPGRIYPSR